MAGMQGGVDEHAAHELLDVYVAAGGNHIDCANGCELMNPSELHANSFSGHKQFNMFPDHAIDTRI